MLRTDVIRKSIFRNNGAHLQTEQRNHQPLKHAIGNFKFQTASTKVD